MHWFLAAVGTLVGGSWLKWLLRERKIRRAIHEKYLGVHDHPRINILDHGGHQILLLDLTYCTPQEAIRSFQELKVTLSNQPQYSILSTRLIINLTDGRLTPESIEELKIVLSENRHHFARVAFMGSTLFGKHQGAIRRHFVRQYPFFRSREDALDFVEHDDQYPLYHPAGSVPRQRTAAHSDDLRNICELFSRLLRYPDNEYWATTERCLEFFAPERTKKLRLMTAFADKVRNLSTKQVQALYAETFERDPACSLRVSQQLRDEKPQLLIDWMERQICDRNVKLPVYYLPTDHISICLVLLLNLHSAAAEDFSNYLLSPAIENLVRAMKGRDNPFENLLNVIILTLDPGGDMYVVEPS